jgi:hypothetical protein
MFETHQLTEQGSDEIYEFRGTLQYAVEKIEKYIPEGREKSLFKTNLETALFWGEKAIAGKKGNYSEIVYRDMYSTIVKKPC